MSDELPPVITDPADFHMGYLYLPRWDEFQHRDAVRTGPPMRWLKQHVEQLDNDAYLDLPPTARALLHDVRMLVARAGQGRCTARAQSLQSLCMWPAGHVQKTLIALVDAGFIVVRAGKLPARCQHAAGTEESREGGAPTAHTPTRRKRARAGAAEGAPATNGSTPYNIDPETVKAIQAGYEPGWLTDDQIAAVRGEEAL